MSTINLGISFQLSAVSYQKKYKGGIGFLNGTTGTNLYVSTDGGISFNAITGGPSNSFMPQRANYARVACSGDTSSLLIAYANGWAPVAALRANLPPMAASENTIPYLVYGLT